MFIQKFLIKSVIDTLAIVSSFSIYLPLTPVRAQSSSQAAHENCTPDSGLSFLCGIKSPEDVAGVPGTDWLVSGSFVTDGSGGLYAFNSKQPTLVKIYPAAGAQSRPDRTTYPDCAAPPDPKTFAALGLSIRPRAGHGATLYVVGHGAREGVEVFDLDTPQSGAPKATWIGCVASPKDATLNAVAGMFPGEILTSAIFEEPLTFADALAGKITGNIYARGPGEPFRKLPGTALAGDNGIEVTRDHRWLFVAATGTRQVLRYDRTDTTKRPDIIELGFGPDNLRWSPNHQLLVAGGERPKTCASGPSCPSMAVVGAIDPETLKLSIVTRFPTTAHWNGLSGAAIANGTLLLGSHGGDRLAYRLLEARP